MQERVFQSHPNVTWVKGESMVTHTPNCGRSQILRRSIETGTPISPGVDMFVKCTCKEDPHTWFQLSLAKPMETWSDQVRLEVEVGLYGNVYQRSAFRAVAQKVVNDDGQNIYNVLMEMRDLPENRYKLAKDWIP